MDFGNINSTNWVSHLLFYKVHQLCEPTENLIRVGKEVSGGMSAGGEEMKYEAFKYVILELQGHKVLLSLSDKISSIYLTRT